MRTILIIALGLFIAQTIDAQSDSLIIKLEYYGQMIIISSNLVTEKQQSFGLDSCYKNFYSDFKNIDKSRLSEKNNIINYSYKKYEPQYRTIRIKGTDNEADVYYFQDSKQQSVLSGKYKVELDIERKVVLFLNSLEDFEKTSQINLDSLYLQSLIQLQSKELSKRVPYKIFYSNKNNQIDKSSEIIRNGENYDVLLLYPTIGMSIIDSRFAPEWGASIEFDLRKKGHKWLRFGINYTTKYLYDKENIYNISSYGFLSLNYYFKHNDSWNQKISVGYLVNKSGNDFNGNTWNAYYSRNIKDFGFKFGGFYTKNTEGKYVVMPSIGFNFWF